MNAHIAVENGKPVLVLSGIGYAEYSLLEHFRPFLPVVHNPNETEWRVIGERLPGTPCGIEAQDATR